MAEQMIGALTKELTALADLSLYQYHFVTVDTSNAKNCDLCGLNGEISGVLQNKPKAGDQALISYGAQPKVIAGAAVNLGDDIISDANGMAIPKGATSNPNIYGRAMTAATAGPSVPATGTAGATYQILEIDRF